MSLEGFKTIEKWLQSLTANSRKGVLPKSTKTNYLAWMEMFCKHQGLNPNQLISEAQKDVERVKARIAEFHSYLIDKRGYSANSARMICFGALRGFYTHNGILFGKWRSQDKPISRVSQVDENHEVFRYDDERKEIIFDTEILQALLNYLSFRDKVIVLCLLSTSQDPRDLFKLNVGFVRQQKDGKRLFWIGNREKTGEPFRTFFSQEATRYLRQYVEQERKDASDSEPLFVVSNYEYQRKNPRTRELETVKVGGRMTGHMIAMLLREAQIKMGIKIEGRNHSPFRPKRFRHLFRTACARAGIEEGYVQVFMGHATAISALYLEKSKALLEAEYAKVEPFLTVFKGNEAVEIATLKKEVEERNKQLQTIINGLVAENLELKQRMSEFEKYKELLETLNNSEIRDAILKLGSSLNKSCI